MQYRFTKYVLEREVSTEPKFPARKFFSSARPGYITKFVQWFKYFFGRGAKSHENFDKYWYNL